jgi:hypothetical protein
MPPCWHLNWSDAINGSSSRRSRIQPKSVDLSNVEFLVAPHWSPWGKRMEYENVKTGTSTPSEIPRLAGTRGKARIAG